MPITPQEALQQRHVVDTDTLFNVIDRLIVAHLHSDGSAAIMTLDQITTEYQQAKRLEEPTIMLNRNIIHFDMFADEYKKVGWHVWNQSNVGIIDTRIYFERDL